MAVDLASLFDPGIGPVALEAPEAMPVLPKPPLPPGEGKGTGILDWLLTPNQGSTAAQIAKALILNAPIGVAIGRGAVQRGIQPMSLGQVLKPALQQRENQRLWGAFEAANLIPPEMTQAFGGTGLPVTDAFPIVRELAKQRAESQRSQRNAQLIRQQAERAGLGDLAKTVPETVSSQEMPFYWKEINDVLTSRRQQQTQESIAARAEQSQAAQFERQQRQFHQQMQMQANQFAQTERMRAASDAAIAERQRIGQSETDERARRQGIATSYRNEAADYQRLITEAERNRNIQLGKLRDPLTSGLSKPEELAAREAEIRAEYAGSIGPYEDARDRARIEQRRVENPVPSRQTRLTADELEQRLQATGHDPDYQVRLLRDVQKGLESHTIVGLTPDEFVMIRRRSRGRQP